MKNEYDKEAELEGMEGWRYKKVEIWDRVG